MIASIHHIETETLGLIEDVLKDLNLDFKEFHVYKGDALPKNSKTLDGLIVMGGPMNVDETKQYPFLSKELKLIEETIKNNKPVLGICLGAQLIAKALGAKVTPNEFREVGWSPLELSMQAIMGDPYFKEFPNLTPVFHWHDNTFDIPKGATHLASSEKCTNQAFSYNENVYALQFHPETTPQMVETWVEANEAYIQKTGEKPYKILDATEPAYEILAPIAKQFFKSYFKASFSPNLSRSRKTAKI